MIFASSSPPHRIEYLACNMQNSIWGEGNRKVTVNLVGIRFNIIILSAAVVGF